MRKSTKILIMGVLLVLMLSMVTLSAFAEEALAPDYTATAA